MEDYIQVMTTVDKKKEASKIIDHVIRKRLTACVQLIGPITSTYWWKEEIEEAEEWLCLMKTRRDLYESLEETIQACHPYEEPEIMAVPIIAGSLGYLSWVDETLGKNRQ